MEAGSLKRTELCSLLEVIRGHFKSIPSETFSTISHLCFLRTLLQFSWFIFIFCKWPYSLEDGKMWGWNWNFKLTRCITLYCNEK